MPENLKRNKNEGNCSPTEQLSNGPSRKESQIQNYPCRVKLDRTTQKFDIVHQMSVVNTYANDKTVYSQHPFVIKTSDGKPRAANCNETEPWDKIIVWRGRNGILSDGTLKYKVPHTYAQYLFDQGKIYWDIANNCWGTDETRKYL